MYRLTSKGVAELAGGRERWQRYVRAMQAVVA